MIQLTPRFARRIRAGNGAFRAWERFEELAAQARHRASPHSARLPTGAVVGTGFAPNVRDGESVSIPTTVGTARCDGGLGSTLPPGTYGARWGIGPNEGAPTVFAPEVRIRITK